MRFEDHHQNGVQNCKQTSIIFIQYCGLRCGGNVDRVVAVVSGVAIKRELALPNSSQYEVCGSCDKDLNEFKTDNKLSF